MTPEQLVENWQNVIADTAHIFTWTEPYALAWLAEQSHQCDYIVESGTYMGASAFAMLRASSRPHLWCVDPFAVAGTEKVTRYFLRDYISKGRCEILPKRSPEASKQLDHMRGFLDMVFVDDGHAFENVKEDIECWLPLLRKGGLLCGHDYEHPDNDVTRAVKLLLPAHYEPVPRMWAYIKV